MNRQDDTDDRKRRTSKSVVDALSKHEEMRMSRDLDYLHGIPLLALLSQNF
jgi:hypothetical protein